MNFLGMGPMELMLILVLALIVFGPGKLPEIAGQVGKAVRDVRRATTELSGEFNRTLSLELEEKKEAEAAAAAQAAPPPPATVTPPPVPVTDAPLTAVAAPPASLVDTPPPAPIAAPPAPETEATSPLPVTDTTASSGPVATEPECPPEASAPPSPAPAPALQTATAASSTSEPHLADTSEWHWEEPWVPDPTPAPGTPIGAPKAADAPPAEPSVVAAALPPVGADPDRSPEDPSAASGQALAGGRKEPSDVPPPS